MTYDLFVDKYNDVLINVSELNYIGEGADKHHPDIMVSAKMIQHVGRIKLGELPSEVSNDYKGIPEGFDFAEYNKDFSEVFCKE